MKYIHLLDYSLWFPPVDLALDEPNGLLAFGGDLTLERLVLAYKSGIFPWYNENEPIAWWSPDPRLVLFLDEFKLSRSLKKSIKNSGMQVKINKNFPAVIAKCAKVHGETWIVPQMQQAYINLFNAGLAWSVETYFNDNLVGGLYGVVIGKCFFGESMFSEKSDASKVALAFLVEKLKQEDFAFIDCQVESEHLISLGARNIAREDFLHLLKQNL